MARFSEKEGRAFLLLAGAPVAKFATTMIGIMSAMTEEIDHLMAEMKGSVEVVSKGMRTYHRGVLWGAPAVLVFSRWGKVSAATTSTCLIDYFGVREIVFTGVAGAIDPKLRVGDVVVADKLYQHDMDCRPLFPRHQLPLLGLTELPVDRRLQQELLDASRGFLSELTGSPTETKIKTAFGIAAPRVVVDHVGSGDKFFASNGEKMELRSRLPVACVDMEGAAVAQVCFEHAIPFGIIRTISDAADESAPIDFLKFLEQVAAVYSHGIIRAFLSARVSASRVCARDAPGSSVGDLLQEG